MASTPNSLRELLSVVVDNPDDSDSRPTGTTETRMQMATKNTSGKIDLPVRQISHYQFSFIASTTGGPGTWTLQLVLDQGAYEQLLTLDASDADNLQTCCRPRRSYTSTSPARRSSLAPRVPAVTELLSAGMPGTPLSVV